MNLHAAAPVWPRRALRKATGPVGAIALCLAQWAHAAPPNDNCTSPTPISNAGDFNTDDLFTATATTSPPLPGGTTKDIWFCWTPTWGSPANAPSVNVSFGGAGPFVGGNQIDVYAGCNGCPTGAPIASAFSVLPNQANFVVFRPECGRQYLIRLSVEAYQTSGPPAAAWRRLSITRNGEDAFDCDGQAPIFNDCCGTKPNFENDIWQTNYTGRVIAHTGNGPDPLYPVVTLFNLDHPTPISSPYNPVPGGLTSAVPANAFRYSHRDWFKDRIGSVFGLTLDDNGNIYVAHSGIWSEGSPNACFPLPDSPLATRIGSLSNSSSASFYRLDTITGNATAFNLPGGSSIRSDPGLGNITFDCEHQQLFVSHFGDGRIYRVSTAGVILSAFDFGTNRIDNAAAANAPELPLAQYRDFVPKGERVWAVQRYHDRLYFSVWGQNANTLRNDVNGSPCPMTISGPAPNTVWSVGINPSGEFVANSRRMELQTPVFFMANNGYQTAIPTCSPVSDISFSADGRMALAERSMADTSPGDPDGGLTAAHRSRVLEYTDTGSGWIMANLRGTSGYEVGATDPRIDITATNAAGGCDYDRSAPGADLRGGRLWATGDCLVPNNSFCSEYGVTGLDTATAFGTTTNSSLVIDYDSTGAFQDKTQIGDVEIACSGAAPCATVTETGPPICITDSNGWTGSYTYCFTLNNLSGRVVSRVLIPGPVNPNSFVLQPPMQPGETRNLCVQINNQTPGSTFSMRVILYTPSNEECCNFIKDIELPECDCLTFLSAPTVECLVGGRFTVRFSYAPIGYAIQHTFLVPLDDGDPNDGDEYFLDPSYFDQPVGIGQSATFTTVVTLNDLPPVSTRRCFEVFIHRPDFSECCFETLCFDVPDCGPGGLGCVGDVDGDGDVDSDDVILYFSWWEDGLPDADIDGDDDVDSEDVIHFFAGWETGC